MAEAHSITVVNNLGANDPGINQLNKKNLRADSLGFEFTTKTISRIVTALRVITNQVGMGHTPFIGDNPSLVGTYLREVSDSMGMSDDVTREAIIKRIIVDSFGISDDLALLLAAGIQTILVMDSFGVSDSVVRTATLLRSVIDSMGMSDDVTRVATLERVVADILGATDSVERQYTANRNVTDSMGISIVTQRTATLLRALSDNFGANDVVTRVHTARRQLTDTIGLSDVQARSVIALRTITDSLGISDVLNALLDTGAIQLVVTDSFGMSDLVTTDKLFLIVIEAAEDVVAGTMIHVKNVTGSANVITIKAEPGVVIPVQTIERLVSALISSADGGLLLMTDGVSNWEIVARVGT